MHRWLLWSFIVAFGLNKEVSCGGLLWEGGIQSILKHLYLNVYGEFIYYVLHAYQLACETSTVRTLALSIWEIFLILAFSFLWL